MAERALCTAKSCARSAIQILLDHNGVGSKREEPELLHGRAKYGNQWSIDSRREVHQSRVVTHDDISLHHALTKLVERQINQHFALLATDSLAIVSFKL